jgi:hypothetical protein
VPFVRGPRSVTLRYPQVTCLITVNNCPAGVASLEFPGNALPIETHAQGCPSIFGGTVDGGIDIQDENSVRGAESPAWLGLRPWPRSI